MIRRTESKGLKAIIEIEEDFSITAGDVRSRGLELEFPLDASGEPQAAELVLRLDAPDFEPRSQSKRVLVPPREDSEVYTFLLTAQRMGELRVNLEVLKGDLCVVTRALKTTAEQQGSEFLKSGSVLISIPLYVQAYHTDSSRVPDRGNKTVLPSVPVDVAATEAVRVDPPQAITVEEHYRGGDAIQKSGPPNYGERAEQHEATVGAMPAPATAAYPASSPQSASRSSRGWPSIISVLRIVAIVLLIAISIAVALSSARWLSVAWIVAAEACIVLFLGPWVWRRFRK